jgi:hypothetical protein
MNHKILQAIIFSNKYIESLKIAMNESNDIFFKECMFYCIEKEKKKIKKYLELFN